MLGEPTREQKYKAEDVGTRIQHMMELQEMWSTCYAILTRPDLYHTELENARALALGVALDLLQNHLEAEFNSVKYARVINELPKNATDIPIT